MPSSIQRRSMPIQPPWARITITAEGLYQLDRRSVIPSWVSYVNNVLEQTGRRAERIIGEVRQTAVTIHVGSALEFDHADMLFVRFQSPANSSPAMH